MLSHMAGGRLKRESSGAMRARATLSPEERHTLIPCPACDSLGQGIRSRHGVATVQRCRWCDGSGMMDPGLMPLFSRWLSIANWHRLLSRRPSHISKAF